MAACFADCFGFFWSPRPSKRASGPYRLPELDEACATARGQRARLTVRTLIVCSRLLPISCCILGDVLRPGGHKNEVKNAQRTRKALEQLGPAFIKLGQCVAAREDILGPGVAAEMRKLCDQVIPIPIEEAQHLLNEELGVSAPLLMDEAVAAASLGQVYRIKAGGQDLAMKIQRPGLADKLAVDVVILLRVASAGRRVYSWFAVSTVDFVQTIRSWAKTLWQELDYEHEARSMEHMRKNLVGRVPGLHIPPVHHQLSSMRVLTTQWVHGHKITGSYSNIKPKHVSIGVDAFAAMVLNIGLVHADPHAGNVLITYTDEVCLLDFGMVVEVPVSHRMAWAKCIYAMIRKDHNQTLDNLIEIGFFPSNCPRDRILAVMPKIWTELVDCGSDLEKRKRAVQVCFSEILTFVKDFEFDLPDYYLALARAMITLEGIAIAADMEFDIFKAAFPPVLRYLADQGKLEAVSFGRRLASGTCQAIAQCPGCKKRAKSAQSSPAKMTQYCVLLAVGVASLGALTRASSS